MILRNPQALYILRNLEKFENSIKIHFFIREIAANFNNFQGSNTSAQKLQLTWCCTCIYQSLKALRLHKNVSQNNFCIIFLGFYCLQMRVYLSHSFFLKVEKWKMKICVQVSFFLNLKRKKKIDNWFQFSFFSKHRKMKNENLCSIFTF